VGLYVLLRFTRLGLVIRALGDAPDACDAAGIRVRTWRTGVLLAAGGLSGLAGAFLSTMRGHSFAPNMTDGRGFLVLALVIFGRWNLGWFALATLAFGLVDSLQSYLSASPGATQMIPHDLFTMLPYLATLIALAMLARSQTRNASPLTLGKPWPSP
jgi:general nucleoside transport system permease protein